MQVNRSLPDETMDMIDHALGRPLDPLSKSFRNHFVTGGETADAMAACPFWREARSFGDDRCFTVTDAGRSALAEYLKQIGDPHRAFVMSYRGETTTIVATNRDRALRSYYVAISDVMPDLTYRGFLRKAKVHVAAPLREPAKNDGSATGQH
ncbi:hypothetical protein LOC51_00715 [Rubrivivax sp. JA1024]|nr:hypothetical protein [Rubrivivax sp. JA1024]